MDIKEAAWNLLDAMQQAYFARGLEERQWTQQDVTKAENTLRKVLSALEEEPSETQ